MLPIAIVGGGFAGLVTALALSQHNIKTIVIERNPPPPAPDEYQQSNCNRTITLSYGSHLFLKGIGAWNQEMESNSGIITDIYIAEENSDGFIHFDNEAIDHKNMGYVINNLCMISHLRAIAAQDKNITLLHNTSYDAIEECGDKITITTDKQELITASFLIAADGANSKIRSTFNIGTDEKNFHQTAMTLYVTHSKSHNNSATEFFRSHGPFALLPTELPNISSLIWTESIDNAKHIQQMSKMQTIELLNELMPIFLGSVTDISGISAFNLREVNSKQYGKNKVMLIGDALHAMHPLAGQGFNVSLQDIKTATSLIVRHNSLGIELGNPLISQLQKIRRIPNGKMMHFTAGLNKLFAMDWMPLNKSRGLGMSIVDKIAPLKKFLIKKAMGL